MIDVKLNCNYNYFIKDFYLNIKSFLATTNINAKKTAFGIFVDILSTRRQDYNSSIGMV